VRTITAGKFRRYHHLSVARQLFMPRIVGANVRDAFKVVIGFVQSLALLLRFRPDAVFAKGGYVCLPVGMAAKCLRIPLVIHDSDARPGLTNTILGRWAAAIATGSPLENYSYRPEISRYVGVPIASEFRLVDDAQMRAAKRRLGVDEGAPLIVVTGGGLGAKSINMAVLESASRLLDDGSSIFHITGRAHFDEVSMLATKDVRYQLVPFVFENMASVLGAADVVIARGSATFTQELAGLGKCAIIVPAKTLGDQRKNAQVYAAADAAIVLTDDEIATPEVLYNTIASLLASPARRAELAAHLHAFARPHAARDVAAMILETVS
jgi:UDP-N-acetylglucosamine--N-acetylmuramyl-(pentapeptide) pyrophosphoryl-undecaprenol N-acetylglucosamine transferase